MKGWTTLGSPKRAALKRGKSEGVIEAPAVGDFERAATGPGSLLSRFGTVSHTPGTAAMHP